MASQNIESPSRNKGQLFTLDLLLSLVPIVIVLGISANAMSGVMIQMQEYSNSYHKYRVLQDGADALVKAPGVPGQWYQDLDNVTLVGFAAYDPDTNESTPNYIDMWKFNLASDSDIAELLGTDDFNITLTVSNQTAYNLSSFNLSLSKGVPISENATNIRTVERLVITDNLLRIKAGSATALTLNATGSGGGATKLCTLSEYTIESYEVNNTVLWLYINFSGPATFGMSVNEYGGADEVCDEPSPPKCNTVFSTNNFANGRIKNMDGGNDIRVPNSTWDMQDSCSGADQNITYYIQNGSDWYSIWAKIPSAWVVTGYQEYYLWANGFDNFEAGWYANAPSFITREQLDEWFRSSIPFDDVPSKLTFTVWDEQ